MVVTRRSKKRNDKAHPPAATPPRTILTKRDLPAASKSPSDFLSPLRPSPSTRSRDQGKEDASVLSPSLHSTGSAGSSARKELPFFLLKQLAQDIEDFGGLKTFKGTGSAQDLCKLCNQREDLYGKRGESLREKITKKVFRWKELEDQGLYVENVLNRFGVRSFQNQKKQEKDPGGTRKKSIEESLAELSISSSSSSDEDSSSSSSADSLPSAVISLKHIHKQTKTDRKIDFQLESPVVKSKKEETTIMNHKMGIPRDCSKYLVFCFVFCCVYM
jgi:hypothetical protein